MIPKHFGDLCLGTISGVLTGLEKEAGCLWPLTIDIQKVLGHDHRPLVDGLARAIEHPTWGYRRCGRL